MWRVLVLTYPIWGMFISAGLGTLLYGNARSPNAEWVVWTFLLPMLVIPMPLWLSSKFGFGAKVLLTPVLYFYAFMAYIFMTFGIACAVFRYSCAMG